MKFILAYVVVALIAFVLVWAGIIYAVVWLLRALGVIA